MRRLVVASALGLALLAATGLGGAASAMPLGVQAPVAATAAPGAELLTPVQYRRPYGHHYHRRHHAHRRHYAQRRHYAPPPRHHHHHRGWRR